jgi:hypothetical protein
MGRVVSLGLLFAEVPRPDARTLPSRSAAPDTGKAPAAGDKKDPAEPSSGPAAAGGGAVRSAVASDTGVSGGWMGAGSRAGQSTPGAARAGTGRIAIGARRVYHRAVERAVLDASLLVGLAGVFLVNAVVAVVDPVAFIDLVAQSPAAHLLETRAGPLVGPAIAVNDFLIGTAMLAALKLRRLRSPALAWAGAWLMVVTVTKLFALG